MDRGTTGCQLAWITRWIGTLRTCSLFGIAALAFSLLTTGCNAMTDSGEQSETFQYQQTAASAQLQVGEWVKGGDTLSNASKMLEMKGFRCSSPNKNSTPRPVSMICVYETPAPLAFEKRMTAPPTPIAWTVVFESDDGVHVSNVVVSREPKDIGS